MRRVHWSIQCQTLVNTDDDDTAREQVFNLFEGAEWGPTEGRELCLTTIQNATIDEIDEGDQ